MDDAARIHHSALIIDTHADTPQRFLDEEWDFAGPLGRGMIDLETARRGNLAAEFFAIWVDPTQYAPDKSFARAMMLIDAVLGQVARHPTELALCVSPDDILRAKVTGRFGVLLGLEGGHAIEDSIENLRAFYARGVRYMTLTWSHNTGWADSSGDSEKHGGLTEFGREVVGEMNRLGMMVDVSHASDATFWQTLAISKAPAIASHSSARAVTAAPRNLTDEQLRALATNGGIACVNFFPAFIDEQWRQAWNECAGERARLQTEAGGPYVAVGEAVPFAVSDAVDRVFTARIGRPPLGSLMAHFEHMIAVAGVDHVGLGSDFDGIPATPQGVDSAGDLGVVSSALWSMGLSAEEIGKVLGGNLMRVFGAVQRFAQGH